ncbi:hypothetical protein A6A04_04215 [Paramagnetospirillum marisnigri]|uniref:Peptidase M48 domain-containing protein n=1 Tax=Paramagnetospirillum marisnigri TaxID=1285242 RepID=A0A178MH08_9PROT|nr:M48 family metalloprotease [Paramagnetospirillum marisnigri]OAN47972.1 hypothetical protein A6A04_04215 [Paramagnetospirillum marisnigri]
MRFHLDPVTLADQRRRNLRDTVLILAGIFSLMALIGWMLAGGLGIALSALGTGLGLLLHPHAAGAVMRHLLRARPLPPALAPRLWQIHAELSRRADLDIIPPLYLIPDARIQALSSGWGRDAAVAVSEGLLYRLSPREVAAVLAHEIGHIRAGDLRILRLAEMAGRLTRAVALASVLLLVYYLPEAMALGASVSPLALAAITLGPIACDLLILKLSRTREFAADATACELTGDPEALIAVLSRLGGHWDRRGALDLSLIRTHPTIPERIERLRELSPPRRPGPWEMFGMLMRSGIRE